MEVLGLIPPQENNDKSDGENVEVEIIVSPQEVPANNNSVEKDNSSDNDSSGSEISPLNISLTAKGGYDLGSGWLGLQRFAYILAHPDEFEVLDKVPVGLKNNKYYIINNQENIDKRARGESSHFWSDVGAWDPDHDASTTTTKYYCGGDGSMRVVYYPKKIGLYCIEKQINKKRTYVPLEPQPEENQIVYVMRHYNKKTYSDENGHKCVFERRVMWVTNMVDSPPIAVHEFLGMQPQPQPHGNSHQCTRNYVQSGQNIMKAIHENALHSKPRMLYNRLLLENHDATRASQPRDYKQVANARYYAKRRAKNNQKSANHADHIQGLENVVQLNDFVQKVIHQKNKATQAVFHTEEQILDLARCCCMGGVAQSTPLHVDKTYNLAQVLVTFLSYKNIALLNKHNEHPTFCGPVFFHDDSDRGSFDNFFSHLASELRPFMITKPVFVSDREGGINSSVAGNFDPGIVACTGHLKENTSSYVGDLAIEKKDKDTIVRSIFGENGLSSADTQVVFDHRKSKVVELCSEFPKALQYLNKQIFPPLQTNLNLGYVNYTNNLAESLNHVAKVIVNWEVQSVTDLATKIHENLVKVQFIEVERAITGDGPYRLAPEFKRFYIAIEVWEAMSPENRKKHVTKFLKARKPLPNKKFAVSSNGRVELIHASGGQKPNQRKRTREAKTRSANQRNTPAKVVKVVSNSQK